jgi:hypothetical protein
MKEKEVHPTYLRNPRKRVVAESPATESGGCAHISTNNILIITINFINNLLHILNKEPLTPKHLLRV